MPSQMSLINAVEKNQISIIQEICQATDTENQPSSEEVHQALTLAAKQKKLQFVIIICAMKGDNKPSQNAISDAVDASATWEIAEWLFSRFPLNQGAIDNLLLVAASKGNADLVKKICASALNKPSISGVVKALVAAAEQQKFLTVQTICAMTGDNKPSQNAISDAVDASATWEIAEWLFSRFPLNQGAIDNLLLVAASKGNADLVKKICASALNKPSISGVAKALVAAAEQQKFLTVQTICAMTGDNKPSQNAISDAVDASATWEIAEWLFSRFPLNQGAIDNLLLVAASKGNEDLVKKICNSASNRPSTSGVATALVAAAKEKKLQVVQTICAITSDIKPNQNALSDALDTTPSWEISVWLFINFPLNQTATDKLLLAAAKQKRLDVVQTVCSNTRHNKPTADAISAAVCPETSWDIAEWLFNNHSLNQSTIDYLLLQASQNNLDLVKKICKSEWNKPSISGVAIALDAAAKLQRLQTVQTICTMTGDNKPSNNVISSAVDATKSWEITAWISSNYKLNQKTIDSVFVDAARKGRLDIIELLCDKNRPSPSVVKEVLSQPEVSKHPQVAKLLQAHLTMIKAEVFVIRSDYILEKGPFMAFPLELLANILFYSEPLSLIEILSILTLTEQNLASRAAPLIDQAEKVLIDAVREETVCYLSHQHATAKKMGSIIGFKKLLDKINSQGVAAIWNEIKDNIAFRVLQNSPLCTLVSPKSKFFHYFLEEGKKISLKGHIPEYPSNIGGLIRFGMLSAAAAVEQAESNPECSSQPS